VITSELHPVVPQITSTAVWLLTETLSVPKLCTWYWH